MIDTAPDKSILEEPAILSSTTGAAVWRDEDDEELIIDLNQTDRLKKLIPISDKNRKKSTVTAEELSKLLQDR
jgi:hypothetical protein